MLQGVHLHILQIHHYRVSMTYRLSTYDARFAQTLTYISVTDESNQSTLQSQSVGLRLVFWTILSPDLTYAPS